MFDFPIHTVLDAQICRGTAMLPAGFVRHQVDYIRQRQLADGGFPGRIGGSDLYYSEFAVRLLNISKSAVTIPDISLILKQSARYMLEEQKPPGNIVECFSLLNLHRILGENALQCPLELSSIGAVLETHRANDGGFARRATAGISLYNTFLGLLCAQMLDGQPPVWLPPSVVDALRSADGGYRESSGFAAAEVNATAAAVACLLMTANFDAIAVDQTSGFLANLQAHDGGLRSHSTAICSDLLSTFSGLVTLHLLGALGKIDLAAVARFLKSTAEQRGGFKSCPADAEADIEYTYYGLAAAGLLKAYAATESGELQ